jgi:hypothetical protein
MNRVCIYDRNGWRLTSYGNGWAYLLEDTEADSHKSAWFQDDDATEFASQVMSEDGFMVDNCEERFADYSEVMTNA